MFGTSPKYLFWIRFVRVKARSGTAHSNRIGLTHIYKKNTQRVASVFVAQRKSLENKKFRLHRNRSDQQVVCRKKCSLYRPFWNGVYQLSDASARRCVYYRITGPLRRTAKHRISFFFQFRMLFDQPESPSVRVCSLCRKQEREEKNDCNLSKLVRSSHQRESDD